MTENKIKNSKYREDLTKEKFDAAVSQLNKEGRALTIRAIKEIAGGSNETISGFMREYNKTIMEASFNELMPQSFQHEIQKATLNLYQSFIAKINADRAQLQNEYDAKHKEIGELIAENEKKQLHMQERIKILETDIVTKEDRIKELEAMLAEQVKANTALTHKLEQQNDDKQQAILDAIAKLSK